MGKWKQRRKYGSRYKPTNRKGSDGANLLFDSDEQSMKLDLSLSQGVEVAGGLKFVESKITSDNDEDIVFGLDSLASMALENNAPDVIIKSKLVSSVVAMLSHDSIQVRLSAVGVLRNICAGGTDEVVTAVIDLNLLDPLSDLILESNGHCNTPLDNPSPPCKLPTRDHLTNPDICWNQILINSISLMWSLCECCDLALEVFNKKELINVVISHIQPMWGQAMAMACADCLLCVSEENEAMESMKEQLNHLIRELISHNNSLVHYKYLTTLTGVLANISDSRQKDTPIVLKCIANALDYNLYTTMKLPSGDETLSDLLSAQHLALEIFSNCCCPDDGDDSSTMSDSWDSITDGMEVEAMDIADNTQFHLLIPIEVYECIKSFDLVTKTLSKVGVVNEEVCQFISKQEESEQLLLKLKILQIRALICLQNLIGCLDIEVLGGHELLQNIWIDLGKLIFSSNKSDEQMLEPATGALRAITEKLSNENTITNINNISQEELKMLYDLGLTCSTANVRANIARTIGSLGCLIVKFKPDLENETAVFLSDISHYLIKTAEQDDELWVIAEALDILIDIFSDDKTDKIALQIGLVERLKGIKTNFMLKCRERGKKSASGHDALLSTVRDNLASFIKYKNSRVNKIGKKKGVKH